MTTLIQLAVKIVTSFPCSFFLICEKSALCAFACCTLLKVLSILVLKYTFWHPKLQLNSLMANNAPNFWTIYYKTRNNASQYRFIFSGLSVYFEMFGLLPLNFLFVINDVYYTDSVSAYVCLKTCPQNIIVFVFCLLSSETT